MFIEESFWWFNALAKTSSKRVSRSAIEAHRTTIYKNDNLNNICARQHCACQRGLSIKTTLNQQHSARVRQLKRTELAWRVESAQCLRLFSRSLNSCCRSYNRRSLSNVHRTFFTRKNRRFSGAPNARIVRQSRSFDRREIRTLCRGKEKAILGINRYVNPLKNTVNTF